MRAETNTPEASLSAPGRRLTQPSIQRKGCNRARAHIESATPTALEPKKIRTFLSHGIADYGDDLLAKVARQLKLTKAELLDLIDCRMSGEDYVALLRERGELE